MLYQFSNTYICELVNQFFLFARWRFFFGCLKTMLCDAKAELALYFHLLEQVLDTNPVHAKALYRRGMSYMLLGEFDDARNDFEKVGNTTLECHV